MKSVFSCTLDLLRSRILRYNQVVITDGSGKMHEI